MPFYLEMHYRGTFSIHGNPLPREIHCKGKSLRKAKTIKGNPLYRDVPYEGESNCKGKSLREGKQLQREIY